MTGQISPLGMPVSVNSYRQGCQSSVTMIEFLFLTFLLKGMKRTFKNILLKSRYVFSMKSLDLSEWFCIIEPWTWKHMLDVVQHSISVMGQQKVRVPAWVLTVSTYTSPHRSIYMGTNSICKSTHPSTHASKAGRWSVTGLDSKPKLLIPHTRTLQNGLPLQERPCWL